MGGGIPAEVQEHFNYSQKFCTVYTTEISFGKLLKNKHVWW